MTHIYIYSLDLQAGEVSTSVEQPVEKEKEALKSDVIIESLASTSEPIANLANGDVSKDAIDITSVVVESAPSYNVCLPDPEIKFYKGMLESIVHLCGANADIDVGIMGGSNKIVHEVCMGIATRTTLLDERWKQTNLIPLGLVVVNSSKHPYTYDDVTEKAKSLFSSTDATTVLVLWYRDVHTCEWFQYNDNVGLHAVASTPSSRKKNVTYHVYKPDMLLSREDLTLTTMRSAVSNFVSQKSSSTMSQDSSAGDNLFFTHCPTPPDGHLVRIHFVF